MINSNISKLRELMKKNKVDLYMIKSGDYHNSEYVGPHFKFRHFMSGFTGSNGDMIVTQSEAILWTDGRYFVQALNELKGSEIKMYKMGVEGYDTLKEYILKNSENKVLGLDGRIFTADLLKELEEEGVNIKSDLALIDEIWEDRAGMPFSEVFYLDEKYSGKSPDDKLEELRKVLKKEKAQAHFISALDEICWLYNIRARDIKSTPVVLSYSLITEDEAILFVDKKKIKKEIEDKLNSYGVKIKEYKDVDNFIKNRDFKNVMVDDKRTNYYLYKLFESKTEIIKKDDPIVLMKSIKNKVEIENTKKAHIIDGVAVTRFMYWLKNSNEDITEYDAHQKIDSLRAENDNFIEPSFTTISAYGANGAMMHYSAKKDNHVYIKKGDLFLIDSGGHYYLGSTDITRTYAVGEISHKKKWDYTMALKSMIGLSQAVFLYGSRGTTLDILCRINLWKEGLDYRSGTGHGVGYLLGVHEAPNGFRWKVVPERNDSAVLEEGMITTVEPGIYRDNEHGIRHENMLVTKKAFSNEYGQFMDFENICFSPFDLDAIDKSLLTEEEIKYLNNYHKEVFEKISPALNEDEREFLKEYTKEI